MAPWVYNEKFLADVRFLFGTLPFTVEEDDDLERPTQEQEEGHMTSILSTRLKNKKSGSR
jgi:hypothetical protein